jgi:hypothetical protein
LYILFLSFDSTEKEKRKARKQVIRQQLLTLLEQHSSQVGDSNNGDYDNDDGKVLLSQVQSLVQEYPSILKRPLLKEGVDDNCSQYHHHHRHYQGCLILHVALQHKAPLSIIQYLVRKHPESMYYKDSSTRMVALHYATVYQASLAVVKYLVKTWPHAMSASSIDGQLPLHMACQYSCSRYTEGVVEYLVQQRPILITSMNHRHGHWCPLHYAAANPQASLQTIQYLVQQAAPTEIIQKRSSSGRLALHLACWNAASLPVIQYLYKCFPMALQMVDYKQALPLHLACGGHWRNGRRAKLAVVEFLLQAWPEAIQAKTKNYRLPLHECCLHLAPLEVVQYVYELFPEAVHCKTREGKTPLDEALAPRYGEVEPLADVVEFMRSVTVKQSEVVATVVLEE